MKKVVLIIVIISVFSYFAFPIFWGAKREDVNSQFVYDEFEKMSGMDPFDFLATKVASPVLAYIGSIGDRALYYVNLGVGTLLFGSDYSEGMLDYKTYGTLTDSLGPVFDLGDQILGFGPNLFKTLGDLFGYVFGGNE